jgi:hypothetical protein
MEIGKLTSVEPRAVWQHEAHNFTPWLAAQIDRLGEAIGEDLEVLGSEMAVGPFSADIVARNRLNGHTVLIENQLEKSDHTHLGQILTYLAGLEAKTIVWVSTRFQEEHLSAIRWLNDHTPPDYSFFAIELRVVRIGDSAAAPIFDLVARPNLFERNLKVRKAEASGPVDSRLRDFWDLYMQRHPEDAAIGMKVWNTTNVWLSVGEGIILGAYLTRTCGVYVRGQSSVPIGAVIEQLEPHRQQLEDQTGAVFGQGEANRILALAGPAFGDPTTWDEAADWLHGQLNRHFEALRCVLDSPPALEVTLGTP